jgi:hypothetical protein
MPIGIVYLRGARKGRVWLSSPPFGGCLSGLRAFVLRMGAFRVFFVCLWPLLVSLVGLLMPYEIEPL